MASTNDSSLRLLAEICSNLPYLTIDSHNQLQNNQIKRQASPLRQNIHKNKRKKLNTSLLPLFNQQQQTGAETAEPATPPTSILQVSRIQSTSPLSTSSPY